MLRLICHLQPAGCSHALSCDIGWLHILVSLSPVQWGVLDLQIANAWHPNPLTIRELEGRLQTLGVFNPTLLIQTDFHQI